jgi:hypothetical protein
LLHLLPATANCTNVLRQTIFLSQTDIFWLVFIQFYSAGSHTEHHWRCSHLFLQS